jgi:hypothetical protein
MLWLPRYNSLRRFRRCSSRYVLPGHAVRCRVQQKARWAYPARPTRRPCASPPTRTHAATASEHGGQHRHCILSAGDGRGRRRPAGAVVHVQWCGRGQPASRAAPRCRAPPAPVRPCADYAALQWTRATARSCSIACRASSPRCTSRERTSSSRCAAPRPPRNATRCLIEPRDGCRRTQLLQYPIIMDVRTRPRVLSTETGTKGEHNSRGRPARGGRGCVARPHSISLPTVSYC